MAFDIKTALEYGDGSLGDFIPAADTVINAYARVTAITASTITIDSATNCDFGAFAANQEILFHIIDADNDNYREDIGKWRVCKIKSVASNVLTLTGKNSPAQIINKSYFSHYTAQVITIPHFKNVTLNSGVSIKPLAYSGGRGGLVAMKCSGTLKFNGGHIDLNGGLGFKRRLLTQENNFSNGYNPSHVSAGQENFAKKTNLTLQSFMGAAFIIAKKMTCHADSRIGNPQTQGVAYCLGAWQAPNTPSGDSNEGGASILIAAQTIDNFNEKMLAKYYGHRDRGGGLAGCYVASETVLPLDEGLYSYDKISDPERLSRNFNINDFGDGSAGVSNNENKRFNCYARITDFNDARNVLTYADKTSDGSAKFKKGALVMIHPIQKSSYVKYAGRFHIARIVGITATEITIDKPLNTASDFNLNKYDVQILTIPQFSTFTLAAGQTHDATMAYNNEKKRGGIFAIAVSDTCTIGGKIDVSFKGGGSAYGKSGLKFISNAGMADRLPLGQGHGSIFILAQNLVMSSETRLGGLKISRGNGFAVKGSYFAGALGQWNGASEVTNDSSGYQGQSDTFGTYRGDNLNDCIGSNGFGGGGGVNPAGRHNGGYGSNSSDGSAQGAHIMIVADKMTGFELNALCTGGEPGYPKSTSEYFYVHPSGASYGGSGFYEKKGNWYPGRGGFVGGGAGCGDEDDYSTGGGSGGFAFVYCNG